jgi:hypothetical protein
VSQPRNGSRWSADLQAATVFRPPSIGRPILFLSAGLIRYETVTLPGLRTYTWRRERSEIPVALSQLKELGEQAIVGLSHVSLQTGHSPLRPDCLAGHVRLELRNVGANYPFERPHRFPRIQPNSGPRDYSRLSCSVAET